MESENIHDEKFNVQEQIGLFAEHKGQIFAAATFAKWAAMEGIALKSNKAITEMSAN